MSNARIMSRCHVQKQAVKRTGVNGAPPLAQIKMIDNYIIDHKRFLGKGEYGMVYLAQEIPENKCKWKSTN